ncbi:hypothetical protein G6F68_018242 [Rhizopus microsporus]|nr:hypothetical protein G6F68_018242 [Rhizopus microsporus]
MLDLRNDTPRISAPTSRHSSTVQPRQAMPSKSEPVSLQPWNWAAARRARRQLALFRSQFWNTASLASAEAKLAWPPRQRTHDVSASVAPWNEAFAMAQAVNRAPRLERQRTARRAFNQGLHCLAVYVNVGHGFNLVLRHACCLGSMLRVRSRNAPRPAGKP